MTLATRYRQHVAAGGGGSGCVRPIFPRISHAGRANCPQHERRNRAAHCRAQWPPRPTAARILTADTLLRKTANHDTCLHAAAISGHLDQIPVELTQENLILSSKSGHTPIHAAAESGYLGKIPADRLTLELLVSRNEFGDTPLHAAAVEGHLKDVPRQFLNRTTLTLKNYTGGTAIGAAIHNGHADQLPREFQPRPPTLLQRLLYKTGFFRAPYA